MSDAELLQERPISATRRAADSGGDARTPTLYLSYDGMLEPLGQSQVIAYLEPLARDYAVHLISFEKPADWERTGEVTALRQRLRTAGIVWHPRRYHKRPRIISTLWDMAGAVALAATLSLRLRPRVLHARSILCAAMLYPAKVVSGARFLVDIRGFWADERVDGGMIRRNGAVYRVLKLIERAMLRRADQVVTLTAASVPVLRDDPRLGRTRAPIAVIPTCADLDRFAPGEQPRRDGLVIGYVGQIGTWYMLDDMLAFFKAVQRRRPDARLLIVNQRQQDAVRDALARADIAPDTVEIVGAKLDEVPALMRRMDAGLAFIHPYFSKIASAPTKFAEYLGCGVPVVGNAGCGDMATIIAADRIGVALPDTEPASIETAADHLLTLLADDDLANRCRDSAVRHFSLAQGVADYRAIYDRLVAA